MEMVTVKTTDLHQELSDNRNRHRRIFEEAQGHYREQAIKELDQMLADAREGRVIKRMVILPEPEDHTDDYDRVLRMLEMSVHDETELSENDFEMFVMDRWGWERSFDTSTRAYNVQRR